MPISDIAIAMPRLARTSISFLPKRSAIQPQNGATKAAEKNVAPKAMPDHCAIAAWSVTPSSAT